MIFYDQWHAYLHSMKLVLEPFILLLQADLQLLNSVDVLFFLQSELDLFLLVYLSDLRLPDFDLICIF
jgi:hypothetical protein